MTGIKCSKHQHLLILNLVHKNVRGHQSHWNCDSESNSWFNFVDDVNGEKVSNARKLILDNVNVNNENVVMEYHPSANHETCVLPFKEFLNSSGVKQNSTFDKCPWHLFREDKKSGARVHFFNEPWTGDTWWEIQTMKNNVFILVLFA
ncbi:hypothetical protein ARMGADRAFT_1039637 [Armillaria gallica]|uniref:Uncharacterized protein n=1 Tax=Armillaria gallica TaxID=47427 RepID=A0A2H3CDA0_ARMGA|nr:hypothetical protein ARMGADRAFT_1039637 [Armillaria gallica]